MKVKQEQKEKRVAVLEIGLEPAEMEKFMEEAYRRVVKRVAVPGFRKGKAPRAILERLAGKGILLEEALEHLVPEVYQQATKEQGIQPIAEPKIEILQTEPVVFRATVSLEPIVQLGDYKQVRLTPETVEVTEEQIASALEQLRQEQAPWEPVERPVQLGDLVIMDVTGKEGEKLGLDQKGLQYMVLKDSPSPVPGFASNLEGMEKGKDKEFSISFPADYATTDLAGKTYSFKVLISETKAKKLPDLNDEFAKSLGLGFETIAALTDKVTANLKARAEELARMRFEEKVAEAVAEQAQVEYPDILVQQEIDRLVNEQASAFREGQQGLEEYLKTRNKTKEALVEELTPVATKRVLRGVVLGKIAQQEDIKVAPEEVSVEIDRIAAGSGERAAQMHQILSSPEAQRSLEMVIRSRKTLRRLADIASGREGTSQAESAPVQVQTKADEAST